jgi:hypothetical protein
MTAKKPSTERSVYGGLAAEGELDDSVFLEQVREKIVASDIAFQAALDHAITAKLEICSTSPSTEPGTRKPKFIPHDYY